VYDLVIVGDGVAANAALVAAGSSSTLKTAVVAPDRRFAPLRIGEHLSASANGILKEMGLWNTFVAEGHLETPSSYSAWGSETLREQNTFGDPRGAGWALDRTRFENWLRNEADHRAHPVRIRGTVSEVFDDAGMTLRLRDGSHVRGRFILDASGRTAAVARHFTGRSRLDQLVAVYNGFEQVDSGIEPSAGPLVEAMPHGWFYSALLPGRRLIVAWFTDRSLLAKSFRKSNAVCWWKERVRASVYTSRRVESAGYSLDFPILPMPAVADAGTRLSLTVVGEGWAAAGDAAATFDPLSSHGLTTALWAGKRAAEGITRMIEGDSETLSLYQRDYLGGMGRHRRQAPAIYASEPRFNDDFWAPRKIPPKI